MLALLELAGVVLALAPEVVVVVDADARPFASDFVGTQEDVAGAGCAGGVTGWPWWNVEVPYTPIGC